MVTMVSKFLALPFYPLGMTVVLIASGLLLFFLRRPKAGRVIVLCAGIVLYLFSTDPLSYWLVRSLERTYDPVRSFPPASAIVLLSGGEVPRTPPRIYDEINGAGDRIIYAARLLRENAAPRLIITGGSLPYLQTIDGSQAECTMRIIAGLCTLDTSRVLLEQEAQNTYENGAFTKKMLDSLKLPPVVILVTSALHMPRSAAIFRKLGCTVYPAPTDYLDDVPFRLRAINLLPNSDALYNSTNALHEVYGIISYKMLGRL